MSNYQGKRFKLSQIPDPANPSAPRSVQPGRTSSTQTATNQNLTQATDGKLTVAAGGTIEPARSGRFADLPPVQLRGAIASSSLSFARARWLGGKSCS